MYTLQRLKDAIASREQGIRRLEFKREKALSRKDAESAKIHTRRIEVLEHSNAVDSQLLEDLERAQRRREDQMTVRPVSGLQTA